MNTDTTQLIAVTSQNRRTVTGHAGRCRKFWLYPIEQGAIGERRLIELSIEETFHASSRGVPQPLEGITTMISQEMGGGLYMRLQRNGIQPWITSETDPDAAVRAYLAGEPSGVAKPHEHAHEGHGHHA